MKKIIACFVIITFTASVYGQSTNAKLDSLLTAYSRTGKFNGAVLVAQKGQVLLEKGYGYKNVASRSMHDAQSIFQIGSITKQFTAAIILRLVEQKKLSLQDRLSKFFPAYPKGDSITVEQLLTHTSGIYSYTDDEKFMRSTDVSRPASRQEMMARFKDHALDFSPGTSWNYSNSGYSLLGYIIEEVTGKSYERVMHEQIFTPLGMTHTGFDFTHLKNKNKSTGYFDLAENEAPIVDSTIAYSAGSIYTTVGDLYIWSQSLLGNKILTTASKEKAFTPVRNHYGYGIFIDSLDGRRKLRHGGGIHGFTSNIVMVQADSSCVVLLSNSINSNLDAIANVIYNLLNNKPYTLPVAQQTIEIDPAILPQYVGEYELGPAFILTVTSKDGKLYGAGTGQTELVLHPEKKDGFFVKEVDAKLEFKRDDKGVVNALVLFQGGQEVLAKKIR